MNLSDKAYNNLTKAIRDKNEALTIKMKSALTVPSIFTDSILSNHYTRVSGKLSSFVSLRDRKKETIVKINKRIASANGQGIERKVISQRKSLSDDIRELSESVEILSSIRDVLRDEIERREVETVNVMVVERHNIQTVNA